MSTVHVYPDSDLIEHDTDHGEACICGPRVEAVFRDDGSNGWVIVHHSLDGRGTPCATCGQECGKQYAPTGQCRECYQEATA